MIKIRQLTKTVRIAKETKVILKAVDLDIEKGEFVALMGPSGSGKSTLLNMIGGLDQFDEGTYFFNDVRIDSERKRTWLRREELGIIVQNYALIPELDCLSNIMMGKADKSAALNLMHELEIAKLSRQQVKNCSGGEKQRVALARALIKKPQLLLADEPTGALDTASGAMIMELLKQYNQQGLTIFMVTHEHRLASLTDRIINIQDGMII